EAPATWTYKTVAQFGEMWGFGFAFAAAPEQVSTFSLDGNLLRGQGAGRVEIRTPNGCLFVATLPFERTLPSECGATAELPVGATAEQPVCAGRRATIVGTAGNDVLSGARHSDVIVGLGGKDKINGRQGKDRICGGKGNDTLKGGKGKDKLRGGGGKDVCKGGKGNDSARCEVEKSI
ncbi:MAG: hypothetical protein H0V15_04735, partial [Solirubrobacterales bacterium]|nr:hypothetical protein [Solirubrobacterales bacterium]